jgi:hypothetical protein
VKVPAEIFSGNLRPSSRPAAVRKNRVNQPRRPSPWLTTATVERTAYIRRRASHFRRTTDGTGGASENLTPESLFVVSPADQRLQTCCPEKPSRCPPFLPRRVARQSWNPCRSFLPPTIGERKDRARFQMPWFSRRPWVDLPKQKS